MRIVVVRWLLLPFFQIFRWTMVVLLWLATLAVFTLGVSSLARIFTGDDQFGALDGVQFTEALYQAVFRFIVVAVLVLLLQRMLRWRPGRWLRAWLERADARRRERREPTVDNGYDPTPGSGSERSEGEPSAAALGTPEDDLETTPAKSGLKGRPRAWVEVG